MMKKQIKKKKGLTLIELIVVVAILGLVSGAIYTVLQMTMTSFRYSDRRVAAQSVARLALNDMKKNIGVAKYADLSLDVPAVLPAAGGYIYYDATQGEFIVRRANGSEMQYAVDSHIADEVTLYFDPIDPPVAGEEYSSIRITITIDRFTLTTDVFVQNRLEFGGKITPDYEPSSVPHPAQFIAFE
jgi:prepilin-type N-terminal cleavage/methylation domain-containing protein